MGLLHTVYLCASSLSPSLKLQIAEQINLFQSIWSDLKKMVILSENSCHCNAMQCNFNEGDKLDAHRPLPINVDQLVLSQLGGQIITTTLQPLAS